MNEQRTFTDGRVIFIDGKARRGRQKRADYILCYRTDYPSGMNERRACFRSDQGRRRRVQTLPTQRKNNR